MRLPIALGSIEANSGVTVILPHFVQRLEKFFKLRSSHILPFSFSRVESNWSPEADKWEWKSAIKFGVGKLVDGSRKRIDGVGMLIDGVGMLIDGVGMLINGVGMLIDGVGMLIDGVEMLIDGVGMLIGRAVNICNYLPNEAPELASIGGEFR